MMMENSKLQKTLSVQMFDKTITTVLCSL